MKYTIKDTDLNMAPNGTTSLNFVMHSQDPETAIGGLVKLFIGFNKIPDASDPNNVKNGFILLTKVCCTLVVLYVF